MEAYFEVVLSGVVRKFHHEPAVVRFLLGINKWGEGDEVRLVSPGGRYEARWAVDDFLK